MRKELFSLIVGSVLFFSGSLLIGIGFIIEYGKNFYSNADVHILGVIILIIGILFYVHSGIVTYISNKREKEE